MTDRHIVLVGDSVFDNGAYVNGGPDVASQITRLMPPSWSVRQRAADGSRTRDVMPQLLDIPAKTTHVVVSVGGNDALDYASILQCHAGTVAEGLNLFAGPLDAFEADYREMVEGVLSARQVRAARWYLRPFTVVLCTIYNGNFPNPHYATAARLGVALFNDVILRVAADFRLATIDLRTVCSQPDDFANDIEPSVVGGANIAKAILLKVGAE